MAERVRKSQWDSVDASGHDWNSGEDFDPAPATTATQPSQTATAAPAANVGAAQTAQSIGNMAAGGYPSAAYALPSNFSALQSQAAQIAQNNRLAPADISGQKRTLDDLRDAQTEQANAQINRGVTQGVNELARAQEDAEAQYRTTKNQIDIDERRATDNQALYAAARGDRGGIGAEQYSAIQNAAMQNRVTVNNAQTKMATDITRQIAELRANGEFEKADAALQVTQQYLAQLMQLEQWAANYNLNVGQFNAQLDQWAANYSLQLQELGLSAWQWQQSFDWQKATDERNYNRSVYENDRNYERGVLESDRAYERGVYESDRSYDFQVQQYRDYLEQQARENGWKQQEIDLQVKAYEDGLKQQQWQNAITERNLASQEKQQLVNNGMTKLNNGVMPSTEELTAMSMSADEAKLRVSVIRSQEALGIQSAQLGIESAQLGNESTRLSNEAARLNLNAAKATNAGGTAGGSFDSRTSALYNAAKATSNPEAFIKNNYKSYGFSSVSGLYEGYKTWAAGASGGVSYDDAIKDVSSGRWSDSIYNGLKSRMSDMDIIRTFGTETDDESQYPYLSTFQNYMERKAGPGITEKEYTDAKRTIENTLSTRRGKSTEEKVSSAQNRVQNLWPKLNYTQRLDLVEFLYNNNIDLTDIG